MFTLDTSENVLERIGRLHAATIRGVAEARRADTQFNGAGRAALRAGLRGRIVPRIDGEMHIDSLEIACGTKIIIIGHKIPS